METSPIVNIRSAERGEAALKIQEAFAANRRGVSLWVAALCALCVLAGCGPMETTSAVAVDQKDSKGMTQLPITTPTVPSGRELATLAGGCFWCTDAIFRDLKGVDKVESGYAGGAVPNPSYEQVCSGRTGHAEAIQITFDPTVISFHDLLVIFFTTHDPTTLNRQGADAGTQYRSAIFTHSDEQKQVAEQVIKEITAEKLYRDPIVTEVTPFTNFYAAEGYHQDYFVNNPNQGYCRIVIEPKVTKFRKQFSDKLKR
jgi:peptide-methionine (S)-S-oxide reductase